MSHPSLDFDTRNWTRLVRDLGVLAGLVALLATSLQPEHSADLPMLAAFGLWLSHVGAIIVLFLGRLCIGRKAGGPDVVRIVGAAVLALIVFSGLSILLDIGFGNPDAEWQQGLSARRLYISELLAVWPLTVLVVGLTVMTLVWTAPQPPQGASPAPVMPQVIHVQAQDHYVEVVTQSGRRLETAQFGAFLDAQTEPEGVQCHRSHWVALAHVDRIERNGSAYDCVMSNGDRVPVSRRRYATLRDRLAQRDHSQIGNS